VPGPGSRDTVSQGDQAVSGVWTGALNKVRANRANRELTETRRYMLFEVSQLIENPLHSQVFFSYYSCTLEKTLCGGRSVRLIKVGSFKYRSFTV